MAYVLCLFILLGFSGYYYTYQSDHRQAISLSAYCNIDFRGIRDSDGHLQGASLSLQDIRYSGSLPASTVTITADDTSWDITAATTQLPPAYLGDTTSQNSFLQYKNYFLLDLPLELLTKIRTAREIQVKFGYQNGQFIELPLNAPDLSYWKNQLQ